MIRDKKFKYIRNYNSIEVCESNFGTNAAINAFIKLGAEAYPDTPLEALYDIENDPFEQYNLAALPKYRSVKISLKRNLHLWMIQQGDFLVQEHYMPVLKAPMHRLDESNEFKKVPPELENSLKEEDLLKLHY